MGDTKDRELLKALDTDEDLIGLRRPEPHFNIFESTGDVRHELRHSHFLYFLLNPQATHDLGEYFIGYFLRKVLSPDEFSTTVGDSPTDRHDRWEVQREYHLSDDETGERGYVDILLLDKARRVAVILENKIDSTEGQGQLEKYYCALTKQGWQATGLYLTPHGNKALSTKYVSVSYETVCAAIEEMCANNVVSVADVRTLLVHYTDMVRRDIVNELDIDGVCQRIYAKHKQAIKIVQKRVAARHVIVGDFLQSLVRQQVGLDNVGNCIDKYTNAENDTMATRFVLPEWRKEPLLHTKKWSPLLECILEFAVASEPQRVYVNLQVGPGDHKTRNSIFDLARSKDVFSVEAVPQKYSGIYHRDLLLPKQYEELSVDALVQEAGKQWDNFVRQDLPRINEAIQQWTIETGNVQPTAP